ncbi:tyrosine-type recombinase/integrase [Fundidesulfovibrio butyratiphilus]
MPKKILPLTDAAVRNAKPKEKAFKLSDGGGLYLEVLPSGGKSWRMKYRFGGQEKRLVFGLWPDVSLKQARQHRDDARALVAEGVDPSEKRKQDKAEAEKAVATFEVVARDWHARQVAVWTKPHADKIIRRLERYLFPAFGAAPITDLRAPDILAPLRVLEGLGRNDTAKRLRQYCEAVFAYAIAEGRATLNAAAGLEKVLSPHVVQHRAAITDPKGVAGLLRAIEGYDGPLTRAALQMAACCFTRPGELRRAEWAEFDLEAAEWRIPAEKMKRRLPHVVPLSRQVLVILEELRPITGEGRFVFPSYQTPGRAMSKMTLAAALRRLGYTKDEMTAHGFRSTASTLLRECGFPHHLIETQLAHVTGNSVSRAYDRAQYLPERRKMMQAWADYLDALKAGGKVVPLHREA